MVKEERKSNRLDRAVNFERLTVRKLVLTMRRNKLKQLKNEKRCDATAFH